MLHAKEESSETKPDAYTTTSTTTADLSSSDMGVKIEDQTLDRFGYKAELERRFGFWSMVGLSCTIMVTWEAWYATAAVGLTNGGIAGCIWGFLFCWVGYTAVIASLAELVSMVPTAGGQYHWTYELAPPSWRKFASWITGWQIVCAWQADLAAVVYLIAAIIQGLVALNWPEYTPQRWQGTLIMWALIIIIVVVNTVLVKILPVLEGSVLVLHIVAFPVVLVPLLYFAPHATTREVFTQFSSMSGYTTSLSFFVGLITTVFAFIGADGAIHMCEEVRHARTAVPNALMLSTFINGLFGFGIVIAFGYTVGDITTALNTRTGFLFIDYFERALDSTAFATGLTALFLVLFIATIVAVLASTSRVTWAFARDEGLPGSNWIKKVSPTLHLPINSILLSGFISFLLSFINIGSAVAFNAIVSLVVAGFFGSYAIPIAILAWMRITGQPLEFGPWNMGKFGLLVNILSLLYLTVTFVFSFFPIAIPIEAATMNWSCVLWGAIMVFGTVWYYARQRHVFTGPTVVMGHLDVR